MYYDWMMERYLGKDTPRGDLAGDMRWAGDFPRSDDKETLLRFLSAKNACTEAIQVFRRSFRDYEKRMKSGGPHPAQEDRPDD